MQIIRTDLENRIDEIIKSNWDQSQLIESMKTDIDQQ